MKPPIRTGTYAEQYPNRYAVQKDFWGDRWHIWLGFTFVSGHGSYSEAIAHADALAREERKTK